MVDGPYCVCAQEVCTFTIKLKPEQLISLINVCTTQVNTVIGQLLCLFAVKHTLVSSLLLHLM